MKLSTYISDLLYRYEFVIVPGFGGFITNTISASIDPHSKTFQPPHKKVSYNAHLTSDDGLLANYISTADQMPYKHALNFIKFEVDQWKKTLEHTDLFLDKVGKFYLDKNNNILFEAQNKINYLTSSFGLTSIVSPEIKREVAKAQSNIPKPIITPASVGKEEKKPILTIEKEKKPIVAIPKKEKTPVVRRMEKEEPTSYLKYAAIFIGLTLLGFGANAWYKNKQYKQQIIVEQQQQQQLEQKIESASFVIDEDLPSITLPVLLNKKPYHVIGGAFRYPENATKMVNILKSKGYNARILGINKWGLTQVTYDSYSKRNVAMDDLFEIRKTEDSTAWLLIQDK